MTHIVRQGTVNVSEDVPSAYQIAEEAAERLPEDLTYGEALRALQATIVELRETASLARLREVEQETKPDDFISWDEMERRLTARAQDATEEAKRSEARASKEKAKSDARPW